MRKKTARYLALGLVGLLIQQGSAAAFGGQPQGPPTATPIKHLVVIFQENVSFDHYFGTYPNAANPSGEPKFYEQPGTPNVNGLSGPLLSANPNSLNPENEHWPGKSVSARSLAGRHRGSGSRLHAGADGIRSRPDGSLPDLGRHRRTASWHRARRHHRSHHGLL